MLRAISLALVFACFALSVTDEQARQKQNVTNDASKERISMTDISQPAFDLKTTYVHLEDGGAARHVPVTPDFWAKIAERTDLHNGRLVTSFRMKDDWDHWEMHPAGDELIVLVSGAVEFRLQNAGGERTVALSGGSSYLIPRGTWHTARVQEPCEMVVITAGAGTQVRPL